MTVFALRFDRPDKRAPMIAYFQDRRDCDRTIQSIIHLTAKDYGSNVRLLGATMGYKVNLDRLIEATGETRLQASIRQFDAAPEGARISDRPRKIVVWERATAEMCQHWETAARVRPWNALKAGNKPKPGSWWAKNP